MKKYNIILFVLLFFINCKNEKVSEINLSSSKTDAPKIVSDSLNDTTITSESEYQKEMEKKRKEKIENEKSQSINKDRDCNEILAQISELYNSLKTSNLDSSVENKLDLLLDDPFTNECKLGPEFITKYEMLLNDIDGLY